MSKPVLAALAGLALLLAALALRLPAASAGGAAPVVLVWTTKSEVNTAGFYVYRAEQKDGPFVQVSRDLIPASNDAAAGGNYTYTDTATLRGVTYYYALEDVETSGRRTRHEPITVVAGAEGNLPLGLSPDLAAAIGVAALAVALGVLYFWRRAATMR